MLRMQDPTPRVARGRPDGDEEVRALVAAQRARPRAARTHDVGAGRARKRLDLGVVVAEHERGARPHDGELLARDLGDRGAEPVRVLEADVGEHDDRGVEHVGGVVAAAQARLDHRGLDLLAGELVERRGGQELELGHALDRLGGLGGALHRGAEGVRRHVLAVDPHALGEAGQVRRQVGARAHAVGLQQRRGVADRRALAVGADHVDRAQPLLRVAEHGEQAADALEPEAHAEQLQREQVLLGALQAPGHVSASSARSRASLSRSAWTTAAGALADEALVGELALGAGDLGLQLAAARLRRGAPRPRGRRRRRRTPPPCRRGSRSRPRARRRSRSTPAARAAPRARRSPRSRARPGARARPCRPPRRPGRASRAAPAPPRSRARAAPRPPDRSASRRARGSGGPSTGRRRPGRGPRSPRSRTGSAGARAPASRPSTCSANSPVALLSSSYRRGLSSSRYQSHSSP